MLFIHSQDSQCAARAGTVNLFHGNIPVPAFMPVGTNATVKGVPHSSLENIGYKMILGNTYHLYLRPGTDVIAQYGSLREFSSWPHNILTDSGGFQVFSLSPFRKISDDGVDFRSHIDGSLHKLSPESVVDIQLILGSDIQMQLDVCTPPGISKKEAAKALELTTQWAKRAKSHLSENSQFHREFLFGIVQGNFFHSLREESAQQLVELDLPGYAIGGLSVGESPEMFKEYLHFTASLLPPNKPRYVMGIGTPEYILEAVEAGIDLFDCVYPTRIARNGTCFTLDGMLNLRNARFRKDQDPLMDNCSCPACQSYSRGYLRHLFVAKEILGPVLASQHNLQFMYDLMQSIQESIFSGRFLQFKNDFLKRFRDTANE